MMKKIILLFFLALIAMKNYGQCIRPAEYTTTVSNNIGLPQVMNTCGYTSTDFLVLQNVLIGQNYVFTNSLGGSEKYITITDLNNVVIDYGYSPLTVTGISSSSVRVHLSDDDTCAGSATCNTVTVQALLSCPVPTAVVISDLATTSANFTWQYGASETAWEVIALPATSAPPATDLMQGVTLVNDSPEFLATLLSGTTYKFYYRAVCSGTDKSPWNSSAAFTTLCDAVAYFTEGFDDTTALPNCYAKVGNVGSVYVQSSSTSVSLPNNLYMGSGATFSLPPVSNSTEGTHRIKFKLSGAYSVGGVVEFGFLNDPANANSFVALESFTANSTAVYDEYTFVPSPDNATANFAFRNLVSNTNSVVLDDITWEPIPACTDITLFKIESFTSTTAAVSWTSTAASSEIVYGVAATTANPNILMPVATAGNAASLSNLQANTAYKVWVRSVCAANTYGAWIGPITITTTCAPVTTFSENFDASSNIPGCFKRVGSGGNAYIQSSALNLSSYQDGNAGNAMSYGIVALPAIGNAAAGTHRLKFTIKSSGSVGGVIELGYLTNPGNAADFTAVQAFTSTSTTAQTIVYIPAAGAITAEVLAFRHTGNPSSTVVIDDLVWETAPNCGDVTAVQATEISNASAKISWTGTTETSWEVAYGATTVTDPTTLTPIAVGTTSATFLNGLTSSSTCKVWVRSNCNALGFGAWIGPIQFTTACDPVTEFSQNFNASSNLPGCWSKSGGFVINMSSSDNSFYLSSLDLLATPLVSNASTGTHRLKFKAKAMYSLGGTLQVGYMTSYNTAATFVPLQSFTPTSTEVFDEFFVNLGTMPTTGYLAIKHSGNSFNAVAVDDIVWEALPTCEEVGQLANSTFTNTTATVSWQALSSTSWEVVHTEASNDVNPSALVPSTAAAPAFTFTNLNPNTVYKGWVRSVCGNGSYSSWVGPLEFRTTCDPLSDLPWSEHFDSIEAPALPECWTKSNGNWITVDQSVAVFAPFVPTNAYSGNNYLRIYNGAVNSYMWTPGFELQANTTYNFSTFVQGDGYDGWKVDMLYNTAPQTLGTVQLGESYEIPAGTLGQQSYTEMKREFTPTVSGTYFFAVRVNENSTAAPYYIAFDYFNVEENSLGAPEFELNTITAFPNPVKDILNVSSLQVMTDVSVFNLLGQQVLNKVINANTAQVDLSVLSAGTYLLKLNSYKQVNTMKIIKE